MPLNFIPLSPSLPLSLFPSLSKKPVRPLKLTTTVQLHCHCSSSTRPAVNTPLVLPPLHLYSLSPVDPASLNLMGDLYSQMLPHFNSSSSFNVGFDETFDLCTCRSADACAAHPEGRLGVFLDYLAKIHALVQGSPRGRGPQRADVGGHPDTGDAQPAAVRGRRGTAEGDSGHAAASSSFFCFFYQQAARGVVLLR